MGVMERRGLNPDNARCRRWYQRNKDAQRARTLANYHERVASATPEEMAALVLTRRKHAQEWKRRNQGRVNASTAARYAAKTNATPLWSDAFLIDEVYDIAARRSDVTGIEWQVDHIVPLRSRLVCGLHCEANLRVIPARINQRKNNRHWPDMP